MLPFDADAFLALFAQYNLGTWPAAPAGVLLLLAALLLALRGGIPAGRLAVGILALAWAWNGVVYHGLFFATINFVAPAFAALFVLQAVLLAWAGLRGRLVFGFQRDAAGWAGLSLAVFGLAGYPLLGWLLGQKWPAMPVPGTAPCPTVLVTFGLLLLAAPRAPLHLFALPLLWALIGGSAAWLLGVLPDLALPAAALAALLLRLWPRPRAASLP